MKNKLKEKAILLRKSGLSYTEILKKVPVARSTVSLWLRSVGLSKKQKQRLTEKKLASIKRGWAACRRKRVIIVDRIKKSALLDIKKSHLDKKNLWLMGIMLYWGEGAKSKEYRISQGVSFSNSDPSMIKLFLIWLDKCLYIPKNRIKFHIYIHEIYQNRLLEMRKYWTSITGFSLAKFDKIYFKKHKINSKRRNVGNKYHGLLRIQVSKSTNINRQIDGWIQGICNNWGVV